MISVGMRVVDTSSSRLLWLRRRRVMLASILRRVRLVWRWVVLRVLLLSMSVVCFDLFVCVYGFANVRFLDEDSEREEIDEARQEAYYEGREDQSYEDEGGW
jgi:hypothetical protein